MSRNNKIKKLIFCVNIKFLNKLYLYKFICAISIKFAKLRVEICQTENSFKILLNIFPIIKKEISMKALLVSLIIVLHSIHLHSQIAEHHTIWFTSTSLTPSGIYGLDHLSSGTPDYGYPKTYRPNSIALSPAVVSPDRQVFARFELDSSISHLIIRKITDGSLVKKIALTGSNPQWFPSGSDLFYETNGVVSSCWSINIYSEKTTKITDIVGQYYPSSDPGLGACALSPDGQKIAYIRFSDSNATMSGIFTPYIYDINTYRHKPFFDPGRSGKYNDSTFRSIIVYAAPAPPQTIRHLSWSRSGNYLAMYGTVRYEKLLNRFKGDTTHFWESKQGIMTVDGIEIHMMYETNNITFEHPDNFFFSTTGRTLAYNVRVGNSNHVFLATAGKKNSGRDRGQGTIICGNTTKQYCALSPWSNDGSKLLIQKNDNSLWLIPDKCEDGAKITVGGTTQRFIEDAQWINFSTKPEPEPSVITLEADPRMKSTLTSNLNPGILASGDFRIVEGIAADGAAKIVIRVRNNSAKNFTAKFTLETSQCASGTTGNPLEDGTLSMGFDSTAGVASSTLEMQSVNTGSGQVAWAVYNAPLDFVRNGTDDSAARSRTIRIAVTAGERLYFVELKIFRPPVVFIHGVWSNAAMWNVFPPLGTPDGTSNSRFSVFRIDYKKFNNQSLQTIIARKDDNGNIVAGALLDMEQILEQYRRQEHIAAIRADIIVHSLGGLVSRGMPLLEPSRYFSEQTFGKGRIHKLITMDSPHKGSEYCNFLTNSYWAADKEDREQMDAFLAEHILNDPTAPQNPISGGAVSDVNLDSKFLMMLNNSSEVMKQSPTHTIVGWSSPEQIFKNNLLVEAISWFVIGQGRKTFQDIFGAQEHDLIVGEQSQMGRFVFDTPTSYTIFNNVTHSAGFFAEKPIVSDKSGSAARVLQLLNSRRNSDLFSNNGKQFIAHDGHEISITPRDEQTPIKNNPTSIQSKELLTITAPLAGTKVNSFSSGITVDVEPPVGIIISKMYCTAFGQLYVDSTAPFSFQVTVPSDAALGTATLSVIARDSAQRMVFTSDSSVLKASVKVEVVSLYSLTTLVANYEHELNINLRENEKPLYVRGIYNDFVARDISRLSSTVYTSSDSTVAVASNGVVTGLKVGTAMIWVSNSGLKDSVKVTVLSSNLPPVADAGADQTILTFRTVQLDGSASYDPEKSPLRYTWSLIAKPDGSTAQLSDTNIVNPILIVDKEGYYVARLSVQDSTGEVGIAYTSIHVMQEVSVQEKELPQSQSLMLCAYPDPFSDVLTIEFSTYRQGYANLSIIDVLGREQLTVFNGEIKSGKHSMRVNSSKFYRGIYFCRLLTPSSMNVISMSKGF